MLKTILVGASGQTVNVNGEGEIQATIHSHPPVNESRLGVPYRKYFTDSNGSNNMVVSTNTDFNIVADNKYDIWIKSISVRIGDAGANFNEFGALPALTNGVSLKWIDIELGEYEIHEGIKDNLEWFRLASQAPVLTDLSGGGADTILVPIDLSQVFGTRYGIILRRGTKDKLVFRVQDDLTGLQNFNIQAYGQILID